MVAAALALQPDGARAAVGPVTVTFSYNGATGADGSPQTWVVPEDVHQATFTLNGASAGATLNHLWGGRGAHLTATLGVVPGQVLTIRVGGQSPGRLSDDAVSSLGGYNGGGGTAASAMPHLMSAGGGGATDVRSGAGSTGQRLLVAGGGGGSGGEIGRLGTSEGSYAGVGGDAGRPGIPAPLVNESAFSGEPGAGGCEATVVPGCSRGGSGGGSGYSGTPVSQLPGAPGDDGSGTGQGGAPRPEHDTSTPEHAFGGGGGGGWSGGGAGGGGAVDAWEPGLTGVLSGGGGGGGGSSYITPAALTSSAVTTRAGYGHGQVTITFAAEDADQDGVSDATDRCDQLPSSNGTGCPSFDRRLRIGYVVARGAFRGRLVCPAPIECRTSRMVSVWQTLPGADRLVGRVLTRLDGRWRLPARLRFGPAYYATSPGYVDQRFGITPRAKSQRLKRLA
jgi:hypothetical protein